MKFVELSEGEIVVFKYEFVSDVIPEDFKKKCQKLGEDNWEMVAAFYTDLSYVAIFKKYIAP